MSMLKLSPEDLIQYQSPQNSEELIPSSQDPISFENSPASQQSTASNWAHEVEYNRILKHEALDKLIDLSNIEVSDPYILEASSTFQGVTPRRRFQLKNYLAAGIVSVISTISSRIEEHSKIWHEVKESLSVDRLLGGTKYPDKLLAEAIRAYNFCSNRRSRTQILSLLVTKYSYSYLKQFNPPNATAFAVNNEEELDEDLPNPKANVDQGLYFNPPLTPYKYNKARLHYYEHEFAMAPVHEGKRYLWRVNKEVVDAVIDFVTSPVNIQGKYPQNFS